MNNLKSFSIFTITLFILAFIMIKSTQQFRYIDKLRWLYHVGWISCYIFHLISLILSFLFLIFVLKKDFNLKVQYKFIWIALGLCPGLFWAISILLLLNHL
jgi:hypothetical protein